MRLLPRTLSKSNCLCCYLPRLSGRALRPAAGGWPDPGSEPRGDQLPASWRHCQPHQGERIQRHPHRRTPARSELKKKFSHRLLYSTVRYLFITTSTVVRMRFFTYCRIVPELKFSACVLYHSFSSFFKKLYIYSKVWKLVYIYFFLILITTSRAVCLPE